MKNLFRVTLGVIALGLGGIGCEMHPPSETLGGHDASPEAHREAMIPEGTNPKAPEYFPAGTTNR